MVFKINKQGIKSILCDVFSKISRIKWQVMAAKWQVIGYVLCTQTLTPFTLNCQVAECRPHMPKVWVSTQIWMGIFLIFKELLEPTASWKTTLIKKKNSIRGSCRILSSLVLSTRTVNYSIPR